MLAPRTPAAAAGMFVHEQATVSQTSTVAGLPVAVATDGRLVLVAEAQRGGAAGAADDRLTARATELADTWAPASCPVELLSLTGADGVAIRGAVSGTNASTVVEGVY